MLMNYVELDNDVPKTLHFSDHYYVDAPILDALIGREKWVKKLVFWVDQVEGAFSGQTFSVISEKLARQLAPYLEDHAYRDYDFTITKRGEGFARSWEVQVTRREDQGPWEK